MLWRDSADEIRCIQDFCPHRGAPLSYGEVHDGNIGCRYHGVIVDGTGTVQQVPAMPDCPMEGRKALRAYSVQEAGDAVFVYISDKDALIVNEVFFNYLSGLINPTACTCR